VLDVWILVLPLQVLLSIQRPGREKTALLAIFALGGFSCIASIARLYSVRVFTAVSLLASQNLPVSICSQDFPVQGPLLRRGSNQHLVYGRDQRWNMVCLHPSLEGPVLEVTARANTKYTHAWIPLSWVRAKWYEAAEHGHDCEE
jgi:hypothetical protein